MKSKFYLLIKLVILVLLSSSCSGKNVSQINRIESDNIPSPITYADYEYKYRFIGESTQILQMPYEGSSKVCELSDTLVEVLYADCSSENVWLFVTFITYSTPSINQGWIRESNTEKYTDENQKLVKDIIIPKGTAAVDNNPADIVDCDRYGHIERRITGQVEVSFAGGELLWYYEKDIKYPPMD